MVLSLIVSTIAFFIAGYFLRDYVEDYIGVDGKSAKLLVMLLASVVAYGASSLTEFFTH